MMRRRRFHQTQSLERRLADEAIRLRDEARQMRPSLERDDKLRKARQNETASHMSEWLRSPGLQPPQ